MPYEYESSQYRAEYTSITKKGSKYLRKTLYKIILLVIYHNEVLKRYYQLKRSQGKGHRCAQDHCVRKSERVIYHMLSTNQQLSNYKNQKPNTLRIVSASKIRVLFASACFNISSTLLFKVTSIK